MTTLSKFLCLGMPLCDVIRATTTNAAKALGRPELGALRPGAVGDAAILSLDRGAFDYVDTRGERLTGEMKLNVSGVVLNGAWWSPT